MWVEYRLAPPAGTSHLCSRREPLTVSSSAMPSTIHNVIWMQSNLKRQWQCPRGLLAWRLFREMRDVKFACVCFSEVLAPAGPAHLNLMAIRVAWVSLPWLGSVQVDVLKVKTPTTMGAQIGSGALGLMLICYWREGLKCYILARSPPIFRTLWQLLWHRLTNLRAHDDWAHENKTKMKSPSCIFCINIFRRIVKTG